MVLRNKEGTKLLAAETETQVLQSLRVYNGHESGGCVVLALDDFPNLTQEVSFKQIHTSDVMIFDMNDSREPAVDFYNDIKDIRNLKGGFQVLEHVQREVDYDRFQMALLHNTYLRFKSRAASRSSSAPPSSAKAAKAASEPTAIISPVALRPLQQQLRRNCDEDAAEKEAVGPGLAWARSFNSAVCAEMELHFSEGWPGAGHQAHAQPQPE